MDEPAPNPIVHIIEELFKLIWDVLKAVLSVIPIVLKFIVWILMAIIVLPCVWVAGNIYPWWAEWGEDF